MQHRSIGLLCVVVTLLLSGAPAIAGDLTPPGGPVNQTMKSLDQVEPRIPIGPLTTPGDLDSLFLIKIPGSYYLTGNVVGLAGFHGIQIDVDDVTIDLMGYTLQGVAGALHGISTQSPVGNIVIVNGSVTDWGQSGIDLMAGGSGHGARIENIRAIGNGQRGIRCANKALIRACVALSNGDSGIQAESDSTVEGCSAHANASNGILLSTRGNVLVCDANSNVAGSGIMLGLQGHVQGCTTNSNGFAGVNVSDRSDVRDCHSTQNSFYGVVASSGVAILRNHFANNSDIGIRVIGTDCVIDGNVLRSNTNRGIKVESPGNLIIRNAVAGTTNFEIVANNKVGVIVNTPNSAAILGASGGVGVGTTDPWANLSY